MYTDEKKSANKQAFSESVVAVLSWDMSLFGKELLERLPFMNCQKECGFNFRSLAKSLT